MISVYGRVPFFYYILHFYILHTLLVILFFASGHSTAAIFDPQSPFGFRPATFGYGLLTVYIIWIAVVAVLYFPCRWFNRYKIAKASIANRAELVAESENALENNLILLGATAIEDELQAGVRKNLLPRDNLKRAQTQVDTRR